MIYLKSFLPVRDEKEKFPNYTNVLLYHFSLIWQHGKGVEIIGSFEGVTPK